MAISDHPTVLAFNLLLGLRTQLKLPHIDASTRFLSFCAANHGVANGQLFQDLFVLFMLNGKQNGFFVEFGATDGLDGSNTLLLERKCGWHGILAEPARHWHKNLAANRRGPVDFRCVWSQTGTSLLFHESNSPSLSTIEEFAERDYASDSRRAGHKYQVETVSLNDLLASHDAPRQIDYLSVDTEGSELAILNAFDFARYDVGIISVEHNFVEPDRQQLHDLLTGKGYVRLFEAFSKVDDWYVKQSLLAVSAG